MVRGKGGRKVDKYENEMWLTFQAKSCNEALARMAVAGFLTPLNPTLTELAEMLDPPVSKSALNHRMRKLVELANEL